jgi:t-SNARE complex subunit (syntaxin)
LMYNMNFTGKNITYAFMSEIVARITKCLHFVICLFIYLFIVYLTVLSVA